MSTRFSTADCPESKGYPEFYQDGVYYDRKVAIYHDPANYYSAQYSMD